MYNALTATLKKESAMFKSALAASEKLWKVINGIFI
jgi:hypothetical protein